MRGVGLVLAVAWVVGSVGVVAVALAVGAGHLAGVACGNALLGVWVAWRVGHPIYRVKGEDE